jgi:hypothetical protein
MYVFERDHCPAEHGMVAEDGRVLLAEQARAFARVDA